jgi:membrane protein
VQSDRVSPTHFDRQRDPCQGRLISHDGLWSRRGRHLYAQVLRQTIHDAWVGNAMEWAAALAFYAVLSLFPLILAGAVVAAAVIPPAVVAAQLASLLGGLIPPGVVDFERVLNEAVAARGRVGLFAIVAWLIAGQRILSALVTALNQVSDVDARQESLRRRALVELALLTGLGTLFALALSARWWLGLLWQQVWGVGASGTAEWIVGAGVHAVLLLAAFFAIYLLVPRGDRRWPAALAGAVVATAGFLLARALFLAALDRLWESFTLVYGPLALAALLLT